MTAYAYGFNVTSAISYQTAKSVEKKQTNMYETDVGDFCNDNVDVKNSIPKRVNVESIFSRNMWAVDI